LHEFLPRFRGRRGAAKWFCSLLENDELARLKSGVVLRVESVAVCLNGS